MKKRNKKAGQVTRLIGLEVDEVSLVDKPAIGEEIYLTKSVEGGKVKTKLKKKDILKTDEEVAADGGAPKAGEGAPAANPAEEETKELDTEAEEEGEEEDAAEADGEEEEESEEDSEDDEEEEEAEEAAVPAAAPAEGDVVKRLIAVEKNYTDLQEMLATSLDFHDQAAQALNSVVVITMAALEMLVEMAAEEDMPGDNAEDAASSSDVSVTANTKSLGEVRDLCKKFQEDVKKAGAKISSSRMALLNDIATKLNALISSVAGEEGKGKKKGKKKSAVVIETLKTQIEDLKKSFTDVQSEKDELKKQVGEQATRLGEIESTAGASAGIGDDADEESEEESEDKTKNKSVFAGLIPVEQIKERHKRSQDFLNRKNTKES